MQHLLGMAEDGDDRYGGKVVAGINGGFFSMDTSVGHEMCIRDRHEVHTVVHRGWQ